MIRELKIRMYQAAIKNAEERKDWTLRDRLISRFTIEECPQWDDLRKYEEQQLTEFMSNQKLTRGSLR